MENKKKIVFFLFLTLLGSLVACNRHCPCTQQGTGFVWHSEPKEANVLHISIHPSILPFSGKTLEVKYVKMNGALHPVSEVVDCKSFINIFDSEDSVARRNNEYYRINPIVNYFKDKNYLYFYIEQEKPPYDDFLTVMGKCDDYEVLGGEYLQVGDKIYSRGVEVAGADLASFHTIEVLRKYSEWQAILGKDKNHIYLYDKPMTKSQSEGFIIDSSLLFSDGESANFINKYKDYSSIDSINVSQKSFDATYHHCGKGHFDFHKQDLKFIKDKTLREEIAYYYVIRVGEENLCEEPTAVLLSQGGEEFYLNTLKGVENACGFPENTPVTCQAYWLKIHTPNGVFDEVVIYDMKNTVK